MNNSEIKKLYQTIGIKERSKFNKKNNRYNWGGVIW